MTRAIGGMLGRLAVSALVAGALALAPTSTLAEEVPAEGAETTAGAEGEQTAVADEGTLEGIITAIENDFAATTTQLQTSQETAFASIGTTYEGYVANEQVLFDWCDDAATQSEELFDRTRTRVIKYYELVASSVDQSDSDALSNTLEEVYDTVYDDLMDDFYDDVYDDLMSEVYDVYYDDVLDDRPDGVEYWQWSFTRSKCYRVWDETRTSIYRAWDDGRSDVYRSWDAVRDCYQNGVFDLTVIIPFGRMAAYANHSAEATVDAGQPATEQQDEGTPLSEGLVLAEETTAPEEANTAEDVEPADGAPEEEETASEAPETQADGDETSSEGDVSSQPEPEGEKTAGSSLDDLTARVASLEERVSQLEATNSGTGEGADTEANGEAVSTDQNLAETASADTAQETEILPLEIVDSSYQVSSGGYVHYAVAITNPNTGYAAEFPSVTITGKDANGGILFSDDQGTFIIYPGETQWIASQAGNGAVPTTVEFSVSARSSNWQESNVTDTAFFSISDTNFVTGNVYDSVTGVITTNQAAAECNRSFEQAWVTIIFRNSDGAVIGGERGFVDIGGVGESRVFDITINSTPEYASYEVYAFPWM